MDYHKHVEYLPSAQAVPSSRLSQRFGTEQGTPLWEKTKRLCEGFAEEPGDNRPLMACNMNPKVDRPPPPHIRNTRPNGEFSVRSWRTPDCF